MPDPLSLLHRPLGEPGSGRVRYGAAMALYREGRISAEMLEVYRIASAHDARDPRTMLAERGLPVEPPAAELSPLRGLYDAARGYLLSLDHPGAAEVRAGLPADPQRGIAPASQMNPVVDRWLAPALDVLHGDQPALADAIARATDQLSWITYDAYPHDEIGTVFPTSHAFASILGAEAPFSAEDFDMGLFLVAPQVLYRDHRHAAPELYAPLTGPHGWSFGVGKPLQIKPAFVPVWNPPYLEHLTKVGNVPLLCFFVWTRDVNSLATVIRSSDWAELEAMNIS